jgi:DNA-binding YbaB/EbfC family protein
MFGDIGKLMQLVGKVKTELPRMREKLAATVFSAAAGGGAVEAAVNGKMELVDVKISPELLAEGDVEMLQDLVKAAVSAAQKQAADAAARELKELTGGMEIPGLEGLIP